MGGETDENERLTVEHRLFERERFLRTLIGNLPGVVYRCRADEKFTSEFISEGCWWLTEYSADELTQKRVVTWDEIIHPDDQDRVRAEVKRLMTDSSAFGTPPLTLDYRVVARSGAIKHVRDRFRFIHDAAGIIVALEGFIGDVTAETETEERMRETESRYRLLAENMHDLVCLHALDSRYLYVSPSSFALLGYSPQELVGTSPFDLIHPEEVNCVREEMHERLLKGETEVTSDYRMRSKSGEYIWVETIAQAIKDKENNASPQLLTVSRDVSKRKIAEQERAAAQDEIAKFFFNEQTARREAEAARHEADRANRAKDEFLQLISHEFRTPLTTIKTLARIMQQGGESASERYEYLETIAAESDRQIDMILNLLDVARIEEGSIDLRLEPVDVNRLLRSCDKIERHAANARNQTFCVQYDDSLPRARGDEKAIRRALCSIIENAIKYTPIGGKITIAAKKVVDEKQASVSAEKNSPPPLEIICISITDTGRGIHAEDLPRLFQKFYRGKKPVPHDATTDGTPDDAMGRAETPGVGLGLYLANRLITDLGGHIKIESEVGSGSCFTVCLALWNEQTDKIDSIDEYGFNEGEMP